VGFFRRSADGLGEAERVLDNQEEQKWPMSWTPDGSLLVSDLLTYPPRFECFLRG